MFHDLEQVVFVDAKAVAVLEMSDYGKPEAENFEPLQCRKELRQLSIRTC